MQRIENRRPVDHGAAARIDQETAHLHQRQPRRIDRVQRRRRQRKRKHDDVGFTQKFVQRTPADREFGLLFVGKTSPVGVDEIGAPAAQPIGHRSANCADADDADRGPGDAETVELRTPALELSGSHPAIRGRDLAR